MNEKSSKWEKFAFCSSFLKLTNERWLLLFDSPVSETLLISFSVINIIEAVSLTGSVNNDVNKKQ